MTELERPSVLTIEAQKTIVEALAEGNYLGVACTRAGTTRQCFYYWKRRWEGGAPVAQALTDFFGAVEGAEAEAETNALLEVRKGNPGWRASAWFLSRRFPLRWGKRSRNPVLVPARRLQEMTDEELERYREQIERESDHRG